MLNNRTSLLLFKIDMQTTVIYARLFANTNWSR